MLGHGIMDAVRPGAVSPAPVMVRTFEGGSNVADLTPCIEWQGARDRKGYGRRKWGTLTWQAHRLAWTQAYGPIPDGLCVLHRCDNPPCINVGHLFLGTKADNAADRDAKGRGRYPGTRGDRNGMRVHPESIRRGSANPRASLTEADIPIIRARLAAGEQQWDVARSYGVNQPAISSIVRGRTWRHVA